MDNEDYLRAQRRRWRNIILIFLVVFILAGSAFMCFKVYAEGRAALREAKNVGITLKTADVEYYGRGDTIYEKKSRTGLKKGVREYIEVLLGDIGPLYLDNYDEVGRNVLGFTYETGNYRVTFRTDKEGNQSYRVELMVRIMDYSDSKDGKGK